MMEEIEKQEILNSYKWIKMPRYIDDENLPLEERLKRLEEHHIEETTFLIEKIRELVRNM